MRSPRFFSLAFAPHHKLQGTFPRHAHGPTIPFIGSGFDSAAPCQERLIIFDSLAALTSCLKPEVEPSSHLLVAGGTHADLRGMAIVPGVASTSGLPPPARHSHSRAILFTEHLIAGLASDGSAV